MWFEFIVLDLVVASIFGCFSSPILVVPLFISFCWYRLPKRHMMCVHVWPSPVSVYIIVITWHLLPSGFALFYSAGNKQLESQLAHSRKSVVVGIYFYKYSDNYYFSFCTRTVRSTSWFFSFCTAPIWTCVPSWYKNWNNNCHYTCESKCRRRHVCRNRM